jgi:hypothetical protein
MGESGALFRQRVSAARAAVSAPSWSMKVKAWNFGLMVSARSRAAPTTSIGENRFAA